MDNYELLQKAAKNISKLISLEKAWRDGGYDIEGEIVVFDTVLKLKLKQKFALIRTEIINALNSITP